MTISLSLEVTFVQLLRRGYVSSNVNQLSSKNMKCIDRLSVSVN